jgi:predicted DCC family thiol-disulfide oxidoreductase YuxK
VTASPTEFKIILFDGECILCNKAVHFIIKRDIEEIFKFASLQSTYGKELLQKIGGDQTDWNSLVLIEGSQYFLKAEAVLKILDEIRGFPFLFQLLRLLPVNILDKLYMITAKIRYKLFGRTDSCTIYQKREFSNRIADWPENK